nr:putative ribonuclease H-like domain-containing protein [Tanacetum cinerariifolium]
MCTEFEKMMHKKFQISSMGELTFFLGLQVTQKDDGIFISQDKYVHEILKKFGFSTVKTTSTHMETLKPLMMDKNAEDVNVYLYRSTIGSLMYLTSSRLDIMFALCACARFQVTPKVSHLHAVKRIFRYLKGQPKLGLWYPKDLPFDLEAYTDSDYAGASLDRKYTIEGCQFLGRRLISWKYKKQTIVANSTTKAEYVAASNCCGHVLWIQNQMLDYGYNFMNTKIFIDNESTICIVKNLVFHSKTKHIEIRHHFIRDSYEKRLIQVIKIHTDHNVADLLIKAFNVSRFHYLIAKKLVENADFAEIVDFLNANPIRQGKYFSGRVTPLFETMLIQHPVEVGEGSRQPTKPQHTPTTALPSHIEPIPTVASSQPKKTQKHRKTKRKATEITQSSPPSTLVTDETVHEERGDRVERAATTAASLDAEQDKVEEEEKVKNSTTQEEDAEIQGRYGHDIEINTASTSITTASINITTAEPVTTVSTLITTAGVSVSTTEPSTPPPTTTIVIEDEDLTIAQTLIKIRNEKSKEKVKERGSKEISSETATRPTRGVIMKEAKKLLKKKDQIEFDKEVARNLEAQLQAELEEEERLLKNKSFDEVQKAFDKTMSWIDSFVSMDSDVVKDRAKGSFKRARKELESDKSKKQKLDKKVEAEADNDQEEVEMKMYIKIVSDDEVAIGAIPLATKPPIIVDWKIIKEGKISSYHIIRADGCSKSPEKAYERVLWGDLKSTFYEVSKSVNLYAGREKGRIVGIKRLLSTDEVTAASYKVTTAGYGEFELWKMRIEQYFLMIDYALWEVIVNGNSPPPKRTINGVEQSYPPTTAEEKLARKNKLKARVYSNPHLQNQNEPPKQSPFTFCERTSPNPQPQALGITFKARVQDYMAVHTKRMERFKNAIFKKQEEINDRMVEMEEERNDKDGIAADDGINKIDTEIPVKEAEKKNKAEDGTKKEPIIKIKNKEGVEAPSSQPVGYYLKHMINKKLIKGLVDNHRFNDSLSEVRVGKGHVYEAILKKKITRKEDIGGNFEIPCNIGVLKGINALVDQGSNVNVMPFSTYMKLTDERPVEIDIRPFLVSHIYIYPLGIAEDMLVDVDDHVYPMDFIDLDRKEDEKRPFILGTPFLKMAKAVIKFNKGTITLRSGKSKISFHRIPESLCKTRKGVKNDIEPRAPTITINRLVLEWEERIRLYQEKEIEFDR